MWLKIKELPHPLGFDTEHWKLTSLRYTEWNPAMSGYIELNLALSRYDFELNPALTCYIEWNLALSSYVELNPALSGYIEFNSALSCYIE